MGEGPAVPDVRDGGESLSGEDCRARFAGCILGDGGEYAGMVTLGLLPLPSSVQIGNCFWSQVEVLDPNRRDAARLEEFTRPALRAPWSFWAR